VNELKLERRKEVYKYVFKSLGLKIIIPAVKVPLIVSLRVLEGKNLTCLVM
jgi:hypothetical protein